MRAWNIPKIFVGLSMLIFLIVFLVSGYNEEATRLNIRLSARFSFLFFCAAFIASSLQHFVKNEFTFWLLMNRKFIGITFAINHLIHLCFLILLQLDFHPVFVMADSISLGGGGGAYVFIIFMLISSFDKVKNVLDQKLWKTMHTLGAYWVAAVFLSSYGKRSITEWEYRPLLALLIISIILRLFKLLIRKNLV